MVEDGGPLDLGLAVAQLLERQVDLEGGGREGLDALAAHQHPASVEGLAPGVVQQLARELGLPGAGDALAEEHLADEGEFADRLEAFQEADLRVHVRFQAESVAVGPQPLQGTGSDAVDQAGVRHRGAPCPACCPVRDAACRTGAGGAVAAVVRAAANAAMRVEW